MVSVKRVAYAYNSEVSEKPYFLDIYAWEDGKKIVDLHGSYASKADFDAAISGVIPMLEVQNEDRQDEVEDERRLSAEVR